MIETLLIVVQCLGYLGILAGLVMCALLGLRD